MIDNKKLWEQRLKELEEENNISSQNFYTQNQLQSLGYVNLGYFKIRHSNDTFQINMSDGVTPKLRKQPPY